MKAFLLPAIIFAFVASAQASDKITGSKVTIEGAVFEQEDVSGFVSVKKNLVFASDELASVQVLEEIDKGEKYKTRKPFNLKDALIKHLANGQDPELDLEGVAVDGKAVYVIGSHSKKRFKVLPAGSDEDDDRTYAENRQRLSKTSIERNRGWLFRFELQDGGRIEEDSVERISLRDVIDWHPILG